jgi:hypothetical protein
MQNKFFNYIYLPDLANKFLVTNPYSLKLKHPTVYFKYIFTNYTAYSSTALKALMILESVYPIRSMSNSKIITLKYTKPRCHSTVYLPVDFMSFTKFFPYYIKKPCSIQSALISYQKSSKYFVFPGFTSHLLFPSWERPVLLSFNLLKDSKNKALTLFHKSAFFD